MYKNTRRNILLPIFLSVAIIAGIFIGTFFQRDADAASPLQVRFNDGSDNKLIQTLLLIDRMYVDSVSIDSLTESVLPALISELDPHSVYIPASSFAAVNESLDGEFDGIGVLFNMATDTAIVLNVIPQGPSYKAGIMNGDRIIKVNDSLVAGVGFDQNELVRTLRGKRGSTVKLSLQRAGLSSLVDIEVVRGKIPLKSVTAGLMLEDDVAYLKLATFSKYSHYEIDTTLTNLRTQGMQKLIFDLRGNTGGFLDQAIDIAKMFLPAGRLIVYTEDRKKERLEEYSDGTGKFTDIELAILIDEGSASSSEILAGAIQDNDRGTVIGRRSFGKGLVQQQIPFRDGSALRLTVARYYTPTGRSIQKPYEEGADGAKEYVQDFRNRVEHNELFSADSIQFDDTQRFVTPAGKVVYGGGGIMPDVFIPLDTTGISKYLLEVSGRGIIYRYALDYADNYRNKVNSINTLEELKTLQNDDTKLLNDFVNYASQHGVAPVQKDIQESRTLLIAQLKAYIARNTPLEDNGFYYFIYTEDNTIMGAIDILNNGQIISPR